MGNTNKFVDNHKKDALEKFTGKEVNLRPSTTIQPIMGSGQEN